MVIDNDEKITDLMKEILKKLGFGKITSAKDGFEAVELLKQNKVDLLITDWELSPMGDNGKPEDEEKWLPVSPKDGASFVKFIRGADNSPCPYLPIIMLTGHALKHNVEYARDSGVDAILVKPISADDLCNRLVNIVNAQRFFISTETYKGPCRRKRTLPMVDGQPERRVAPVKMTKHKVV